MHYTVNNGQIDRFRDGMLLIRGLLNPSPSARLRLVLGIQTLLIQCMQHDTGHINASTPFYDIRPMLFKVSHVNLFL